MNKFGGVLTSFCLVVSLHNGVNAAPVKSGIPTTSAVPYSKTIASKIIEITSTKNTFNITYWLSEVQKRFPDISHADELVISIRYHEDIIQELHDPARDTGMALIQKLSETSTTEILILENQEKVLSPSEKNKLDILRFEKYQRDLATILLYLRENPPENLQQCRRPTLSI